MLGAELLKSGGGAQYLGFVSSRQCKDGSQASDRSRPVMAVKLFGGVPAEIVVMYVL